MMLLLSLLLNCAHADWQSYLDREVLRGRLEESFTDSQYLQLPWRQSSEITFETRPLWPENIRAIPLADNDSLWPTHPQQTTKEYLHAVWAPYDQARLPGDSAACATADFRRRYCLRATWANLVVMSDLFEDRNGVFYRAYWVVAYLAANDNMGTLLSKGRTVYPRPNSEFPNDQVDGDTYEVKARDFLFVSSLLPNDQARIQRDRQAAIKAGYTRVGKLFRKN